MKHMRNLAFSFLIGIVFSTLLFAPAYAKGETDNHFNFWYCLPAEYVSLMNDLVGEYNKANPHSTIVARNFRTPTELYMTLKEGKEFPDIAMIDASWQEDLITRGALVPVEDSMLKIAQSIKVVAKMDNFKPLWKSCVIDEKLWTMPYYAVNHALLYNPEHFKDKVIAKPPVCWGDIVELGKKLTDPGAGTWGFYIPLSASPKELAYLYEIFLLQAGGTMDNPEGLKVAYNSEFGQKALQFWVDVIHKHKIAPSRSITDMSKVGMMVGSTKDLLEATKKGVNFKVVAWPIKNTQAGDIEVTSLAIFKNSPDRVEKMWHFTYWLTEFPQGIRWSLATHYLPANKQVTLSPGYFEYLQKNPGIRTYLALMEKGCAKPGMKNWDYEAIMNDLGEKIAEALSGRLSVQEALDKAALRANSLIREEAGRHKTSSMK